MRAILLTTFLLLYTACCFSQNLVSNPSFEQYTTCPNGQCQILYATGWDSYSYSPDYFNACSANFSVPNNPCGCQLAATGNAYVGIFCYGELSIAREYVGTQLITPLQIGQKYKVEFKAVLSENTGIGANCAINKLGVLFTTISNAMGNPCTHIPILLPQNHAHIFASNIISDTATWTVISGEFTADSSYKYIVIGNFFDNAHTNDSVLNTGTCDAYYYVDDVSVVADTLVNIREEQSDFNQIIILPNPAEDYVNIKVNFKKYHSYICNIFNAYGKFIRQLQNPSRVDVSDLPNGIYLFQIRSGNIVTNKKIIINH